MTGREAVANGSKDGTLLTRTVSVLVVLFVVATTTVPTAIVNKAIFGLIMVLALIRLVARPERSKILTWSPALILSVFLYGMIMSLSGDADLELARQLLFGVAVLFLIYPILWFDVDLDRAIKIGGIAFALLTGVLLASVLLASRSQLAVAAIEFFRLYSLSQAGDRGILGAEVFMVRLGSVAFLFLPFVLFVSDLRKRVRMLDVVGLLLVVPTIIASTSRGLVLVCTIATIMLLVETASNMGRAFWAALAIPIVLGGIALASVTPVFSAAELSNSIKLGHAASFADHVNPRNALFGEGLASYYYSEGLGRRVPETEIVLLDHLRYFGFIVTPVVWLALLFPTMRLSTHLTDPTRLMSSAIFVLYLAQTFTNPVLFNAYGLTIVLWYWWRLLRESPRDPTVA